MLPLSRSGSIDEDSAGIVDESTVLYVQPDCLCSKACLLILSEKSVDCVVKDVTHKQDAEELLLINPENTTPTLVNRGRMLYQPSVIAEYFDERFPYPPLMPVDPMERGRIRVLMRQLIEDLISKCTQALQQQRSLNKKETDTVRELLVSLASLLENQEYLYSDELTLADCFLAPSILALKKLGVKMPRAAAPLVHYIRRICKRPSCINQSFMVL